MEHQHATNASISKIPLWKRPTGIALLMVLVIGAFFQLREHWGHIFGFWPYLLLLVCPLMHLFHGHHTGK